MRSKASLDSSREVVQGCEVSFVNCFYLISLIIGQNFCMLQQPAHGVVSSVAEKLLRARPHVTRGPSASHWRLRASLEGWNWGWQVDSGRTGWHRPDGPVWRTCAAVVRVLRRRRGCPVTLAARRRGLWQLQACSCFAGYQLA